MITNISFYEQYPALMVALIVSATFLLLLGISLIIFKYKDIKYESAVKKSINPTRIYVVDFGRDRALFFDKRKFTRRRESNVEGFFHQFESNAVDGIRGWLERLLKEEDVPLFYEADVNVAKLKSTFFSLLQVLKVDKEKKIVYLESYLLRYLRPRNQINRKLEDKARTYFTSYEKVIPMFNRAHTRSRGVLMIVRFFKLQKRREDDMDLEKLLITQLKDYLTIYLHSNRVMFDLDELHVGVFDSKAHDYKKTRIIANSIQQHLLSFMHLNGIEGYSFSIGVAEAKIFPTLEDIIEVAKGAAFLAESRGQFIVYHDSLHPETGLSSDYVRTELDHFIKEKKMQILFRPIVGVEKGEIEGFIAYVEPFQSVFNTYQELIDFAIKSNRDKELFSVVTRKITALFYNEVQNKQTKLFMPVQLINRDSIIRSLSRMNHINELQVVLMFDSDDIEDSISDIEDVKLILEEIKDSGFKISLTLMSSELVLPNSIYSLFDFYFVDETILKNTYKNERNRLYLLAALGKLLRYKNPIILTDLPSWTEIEYFVRAGVNYVSSDEISKKSPMLLPIEKKKITKVTNLTRKR